jgi:hypothetical protein
MRRPETGDTPLTAHRAHSVVLCLLGEGGTISVWGQDRGDRVRCSWQSQSSARLWALSLPASSGRQRPTGDGFASGRFRRFVPRALRHFPRCPPTSWPTLHELQSPSWRGAHISVNGSRTATRRVGLRTRLTGRCSTASGTTCSGLHHEALIDWRLSFATAWFGLIRTRSRPDHRGDRGCSKGQPVPSVRAWTEYPDWSDAGPSRSADGAPRRPRVLTLPARREQVASTDVRMRWLVTSSSGWGVRR